MDRAAQLETADIERARVDISGSRHRDARCTGWARFQYSQATCEGRRRGASAAALSYDSNIYDYYKDMEHLKLPARPTSRLATMPPRPTRLAGKGVDTWKVRAERQAQLLTLEDVIGERPSGRPLLDLVLRGSPGSREIWTG